MRKQTRYLFLSLGILCTFLMLQGQSWAVSLTFNPLDSSILIGESIDIDIVISGMENDDLGAFDFNVHFDDTILTFDDYVMGSELGVIAPLDPLADAVDDSWGDLGGGIVNLAEVSYLWDLSSQPESFSVATLSFTAISIGTSTLVFSDSIFYPGDFWGDLLSPTLETGSVSVSAPIPEPATLLLFGSGLLGLAALRRRQTM